MKKFKFIAFFIAVMTTMPILQSCLDDETKVAKELFSLCSISIFAAFIR